MEAPLKSRDSSPRAGILAELRLLSVSVGLAIGGVGIVNAAVRRGRPANERRDPAPEPSGEPEVPDEPMGVPAEESSDNDDIELPGFPRNDPTHG